MELFPAKKQNCPEAASQGTSRLNGPSRRKPRVEVGRSAWPTGHWPCATERWPRSRKGPGAGLQALGGGGRQRPLTLTRGAAPNVEGWPGPLPPGSPPTPQARPQGRERHNSWPPPRGCRAWRARTRGGQQGRGGDSATSKGSEILARSGVGDVLGTAAGHNDSAVLERDSALSDEHRCPIGQAEGPGPTWTRTHRRSQADAGRWAGLPRAWHPAPPTRDLAGGAEPYHLFTNSWKSWVKTPLGSLGGGCGREQMGGSQMLVDGSGITEGRRLPALHS